MTPAVLRTVARYVWLVSVAAACALARWRPLL